MEVSVRPITVTEELQRQCRKNTAPFVVLIACLHRSGIKKSHGKKPRTQGVTVRKFAGWLAQTREVQIIIISCGDSHHPGL